MFKHLVCQVALAAMLAAIVLVIADVALFDRRTWEGWTLFPDSIEPADLRWWQGAVGPLPPSIAAGVIEPPEALSGRPGTWYHKDGGDGSHGLHGHAPLIPHHGLIAYTVKSDSSIVGGRALASIDSLGYRMGVSLPCVTIERRFVGPSGAFPPSIYEVGWKTHIRWGGLITNVSLLTVVFSIPLLLFYGVRIARVLRGRCFKCAYILMPQQHVCSECGSARRSWL